ncbi:MAG: hypothetical protein EXR00_04115 [Alphaproteobacteria bacterium]|nr:hypothetical protein [Alphaproteobacteria bacterium]
MDKIATRAFPAFAVGFAIYYAPAYCFTGADSSFSWPLFTYFPAAEPAHWQWGLVPGNETLGPPMWWYGWIASATIVGLIAAVIALLLPARATEKMWSTLFWTVPIAAFVFLLNWELVWFYPMWNPRWFE